MTGKGRWWHAPLALAFLPWAAMAADMSEPPMSFSFQREDYRKYGLGLYQVIHATGAITEGTADALKIFIEQHNIEPGGEIYLDSASGNRLEGMRMGRYIRAAKLMTHIGDTDPARPGACLSACAFAYLGGVHRFLNDTATYGVHRFYRSKGEDQEFTLEQADEVSQLMTGYLRDMGVSTSLFRYMTLPGSGELMLIGKETLMSLGAVDNGVTASEWRMAKDAAGVPYMRGDLADYRGSHAISLYCDRQFATMRAEALLASSDPSSLVRMAGGQGVFLGDAKKPQRGELLAKETHVMYRFPVSPQLASEMPDAPSFGVYVQPQGVIYHAGFAIPHTAESRKTMRQYVNRCFGKQVVKEEKDEKRY